MMYPFDSLSSPEDDLSDFMLVVGYIVLMVLCVVNMVRVMHRQRKSNATVRTNFWKMLFYPSLFVGCLMRTIFFVLQPLVLEDAIEMVNSLNIVLDYFPSFVFFSAYLVIMLNWAEIYHNSIEMSSTQFRYLKPIFFIFIGFLYTSIIALFVCDLLLSPNQYIPESKLQTDIEEIIALYDAVLYIPTSVGFIVYCIRIMRKISQVRDHSRAKIEVSQRIQKFTILVCFVFCVRSVICLWVVLSGSPPISTKWWFTTTYFVVLEILPLALMINILRLHPKKPTNPSVTTPLINP